MSVTALSYLLTLGAAPAVDAGCRIAARTIPAGAVVTREDVTSAPCLAGPQPRLVVYEQARGQPVARVSIDAGTMIGRLHLDPAPIVEAGMRIRLRFGLGHVVIERDVVALQSGQAGQRIFVRDANGEIYPVMIDPQMERVE